ncbi:MAG TPA: hypothetical protein VK586_24015 [Streptosporangiaceae bacterium]|nr:hypothetical protein [Streptosporangiaceae bacterium]
MNTQLSTTTSPVQVHADHGQRKLLGSWTSSGAFEVRARRSRVVIDLRSPQIPAGDIQLDLSLDHAALTLADARRAHAQGSVPTLDDPAKSA